MSSNGIFIKYFDSKRKLKKWVRENNNKLIILHLSAFVKDNELKKWYDKIDNNPEENEKANGG
uniref:Uncharacterized protein n=1 Tax=viral metagenome TaxID=1070528 RepID=A0A6H1ZJ97_9ZZZZ